MAQIAPFHSLNESRKTSPRYHTDDTCAEALKIPIADQRPGSGGYYQCEYCAQSQAQAAAAAEALQTK
jgi:hypothetical protein